MAFCKDNKSRSNEGKGWQELADTSKHPKSADHIKMFQFQLLVEVYAHVNDQKTTTEEQLDS